MQNENVKYDIFEFGLYGVAMNDILIGIAIKVLH